jgi:tetratricopeptide (TPR) repeat protein
VVAAIDGIGEVAGSSSGPRSASTPALTSVERRVACLVLVQTRRGELATSLFGRGASSADASTKNLRAVVEPFGGKLDVLADGSIVVALGGPGAPTDLAARAARCALRMHDNLRSVPIALVAGRQAPSSPSPMTEAIERGVQLVRRVADGGVHLDEVTAGLLDVRFDVGGDAVGLTLRGEREVAEAARTLLGRVTPCVGRDQELGILDAIHAGCASEPVAAAVLVTAPAGAGKSRLRYEFTRRLEERAPEVQVWLGRGDPMSVGSPFCMLASAIRRAFGLRDGDPLPVRQQRLAARLGRNLSGGEHERVTEFIGELVGVPAAASPSVMLRAARKDPTTMGEQMRIAWEDLLRAECAVAPVVLVLEDLHWGDLPTVHFVDGALQQLREQPLLVLALARPEVHELFPKLWSERDVRTIRLGQLTRKAGHRLVREVLGAGTDEAMVARIVERSAGNAFYLEELIRSVAEGKTEVLPETVLAMAEARLERLDAEARRVLRAASVFGQVFSPSGVAALLGRRSLSAGRMEGDVSAWLESLARQEVVSLRPVDERGGEPQYAFRHGLVREAAYAMLTDDDRRLGHRLAGEWLERAGLADPMALAEHFERGGEPGRAVGCYHRAAAHALEGNDFQAVASRVERAIACGATGETLGALQLLASEAHRWRGELAAAAAAAETALVHLPRGTDPWFSAANELATTTATLGQFDRLAELGRELADEELGDRTGGSYASVSANVAVRLFYSNHPELAEVLFARLETAEHMAHADSAALGAIHQARAYRAHAQGDLSGLMRFAALSEVGFREAGKLRDAVQQTVNVGYAALELGDYARAEEALRSALGESERLGLHAVTSLAKHNLGLCLSRRGAFAEARAVERDAMVEAAAQGHARMVCGTRLYLALILFDGGALDEAEREAQAAIDATTAAPLLRPKALATLAQIENARGRPEDALTAARAAHTALEANPHIEEGESLVRLMFAETLFAAGDAVAALEAIVAARERLLARAGKIGEPQHRDSFLARVPENARTLELWRRWTATAP